MPPARGNRYGDDLEAAQLGFDLFFDPRALSQPGSNVSCARCHSPERAFSDKQPLSFGLKPTRRNALPLVNAARNHPHFWDGRVDSLWSQSLATIENEVELNGTRLGVAHFIAANYRATYERVFGTLPDFSAASRFPPQGKPSGAAWLPMAAADQHLVNQVFVNVGKSIEAYLRKIASGRSAVDRFIAGTGDISVGAREGMRVFTRVGCLTCHNGPNYSDGQFHDVDVPAPPFLSTTDGDPGQSEGLQRLVASEFNGLSVWYDRPVGESRRLEVAEGSKAGGFLTPSLRSIGTTGPYGHNGALFTLDEAVRFFVAGGGPRHLAAALVKHTLSEPELKSLVEFLHALHGDRAPLPWSFWPSTPKPSANPGEAGP